ncbi:hypothetical protein H8L32_03295 [Undibacterium sp. CY18W]|uniref:Uncharacterized protein n=1 Tax=Undibacterium hunanense TaxID=2762292 RepID=A0ABR6ZKR0_9BURK|nr:hypothetical protein [Undibacterium hunanense]MBC3916501.1 hypothetical protein [Undibacterium hunanense]
MKLKFALILALPLLTALPGVSVFAAEAGKAAPPAKANQGTQAVFVVAPEDLPKQNSGVQIDAPKQKAIAKSNKPDVAIQVWSGPVPLAGGLWILVASMPVLASLYFAYQLLMFIKARRRRLSTERGS